MEWSTVSQYIWKHFVQDSLGFAVVTSSSKISRPYINQCLFLVYAACLMCWRQGLLFSVSAQTDGESFLMYMLPTAPGQEKRYGNKSHSGSKSPETMHSVAFHFLWLI